jgi:recombination protein RecR
MNIFPESVQKLMHLLERLPGFGPKSSARIAMYLLKSPASVKKELGEILLNIDKDIVTCSTCFNIASVDPCDICTSRERDHSLICVVEDPLDVFAFENGSDYKGVYHVLGGVISPVRGIGPEELTITKLLERLKKDEIKELIIATNPNIEGEATAMYIKEEISNISARGAVPAVRQGSTLGGKYQISKLKSIRISRLARGLPSGADLEYADKTTIKRALEGRTTF